MSYLLITRDDGTVVYDSGAIDEKDRESDFNIYLTKMKQIAHPVGSKEFESERMKILQELGYPTLASLFGVF